ncbi:MAG: aminoacetone oxidase family FAD-binding enzyme [Chloroflexi bacterium HGW-Chloroflexi-6]|nr:MAG: aminoacetone oxidase family FAD-binding enzyme [Chloroflexi bacterium HGW-Chloroflexi-6]
MTLKKIVAIIGGGPAGLMAAERLAQAGRSEIEIHVYEAMPSLGRKFLRAGVGGLNLTHSEPQDAFLARYSQPERLAPLLRAFGQEQMIQWAKELGFETFTGTSGRVFPVGMKASPILREWLKRLKDLGVVFHLGYKWVNVIARGDSPEAISRLTGVSVGEEIASPRKQRLAMTFEFDTPDGPQTTQADAALLALGGGSWPKLGSTGGWIPILEAQGVPVAPLRPANCGFDVNWTEVFKTKFDGAPLKSVMLTFGEICKQGEFIVTKDGVEGSLIYALSAPIRDAIEQTGQAIIHLDLAPDWTQEKLTNRLRLPRGSRSMGSHLEKTVGFKGVKAGLLWEFVPREDFQSPEKLAVAIKNLPIPLTRPRPLAEAISSAGGIRFEALDERLMLKSLPGVFCAGEMLDWEAPTGGYLLTGCMSTGRWAAEGLLAYLAAQRSG